MHNKRGYWWFGVSTVALVTVMVIQVLWLVESARTKEQFFNEKANLVLAKTAEVLSSNPDLYARMQQPQGAAESSLVDSIIGHYMDVYNFHTSYTFEVVNQQNEEAPTVDLSYSNLLNLANGKSNNQTQFTQCLEPGEKAPNNQRVDINLNIPNKETFIRNEMGFSFLASLGLILVVMGLTWATLLSLKRNRALLQHTTDFLNNITHEFKTPLANIGLAGKMIEKSVEQPDKIKHYTSILLTEKERLNRQVEQVLHFSASESLEELANTQPLNIHELIEKVAATFQVQLDELSGELNLQLNAKNTTVLGDSVTLETALTNLIDNAIKYCQKAPVISLETNDLGKQLEIRMSDNGQGMDKKHLSKIFDKFYRISTGNVHDVKGFGLGLAQVKRIVELHHGGISVESQLGIGTTFRILLPNV